MKARFHDEICVNSTSLDQAFGKGSGHREHHADIRIHILTDMPPCSPQYSPFTLLPARAERFSFTNPPPTAHLQARHHALQHGLAGLTRAVVLGVAARLHEGGAGRADGLHVVQRVLRWAIEGHRGQERC